MERSAAAVVTCPAAVIIVHAVTLVQFCNNNHDFPGTLAEFVQELSVWFDFQPYGAIHTSEAPHALSLARCMSRTITSQSKLSPQLIHEAVLCSFFPTNSYNAVFACVYTSKYIHVPASVFFETNIHMDISEIGRPFISSKAPDTYLCSYSLLGRSRSYTRMYRRIL